MRPTGEARRIVGRPQRRDRKLLSDGSADREPSGDGPLLATKAALRYQGNP